MGRVRSKTVKKAARKIVEKYYNILTKDFDINKKIVEEKAVCPSKKMRNKVAGYVTHLMGRIEKGQSIKGISLKIQEQEKEKRLNFTPEVSEVDEMIEAGIELQPESMSMIKKLGFKKMSKIQLKSKNKKGMKNQK